jgi:hypothetical protein
MDDMEQKLIDRIRESEDPEKAIAVTVEVITNYLKQHQSFGKQVRAGQQELF